MGILRASLGRGGVSDKWVFGEMCKPGVWMVRARGKVEIFRENKGRVRVRSLDHEDACDLDDIILLLAYHLRNEEQN